MLKIARALGEEHYDVHVIHARFTERSDALDASIAQPWPVTRIDCRRGAAPLRWFYTGVRTKILNRAAAVVGARALPNWALFRASSRIHSELARAIVSVRPSFIYGGSQPALSAVAAAAEVSGTPYALDLEDFYSQQAGNGRLSDRLSEEIERRFLKKASFLTAGSVPIAAAYRENYGVSPQPLHNTFPLPAREPDFVSDPAAPLKLYWFSQTIGPGRGLEDVIHAIGCAGFAAELHLRGTIAGEYGDALRTLSAAAGPKLALVFHTPEFPDRMIESCRGFDVGLCLERREPRNHDLSLSNKALTYMLGGLALVMTDTQGQRELLPDLNGEAIVYEPGDTRALANALTVWNSDRGKLLEAKKASWKAATVRWNWNHPAERAAMLSLVRSVMR
jgi:glycosyltransferase involved in cell wall biosynthesis